eukprot:TRINITY_DN4954_c0_g1_i1.p1 TRINITY_DN4954_c0_g1~~TRINITY_DN4954_c0_g1_i1.p1  ORF type:complete len:452 (+),score=168.11 TRINITY_DN4954_c0_g1_i1:378-1733(+)
MDHVSLTTDERRGIFSRMPNDSMFSCDCEHKEMGHKVVEEWTVENKPRGWELYELLGRPKNVLAPMVDASELSFRLLCKRYGADLCYTPMVNTAIFTKETAQAFRLREYSTCPADTNMILQFCGHDPELLVQAGRLIANSGCKAIDLNLGCPQGIARKGFYGAFLMDDLPLVRSLISTMDKHLPIPITAKIRVFPDPLHTLAYARMLIDAGATMLCVHGRRREQKGVMPGEADWDQIRMVKEAITEVPVFANGNIWSYDDIGLCLKETKADAVMSADSLLWEPRLFSNPRNFLVSGRHFDVTDVGTRVQGIETCLEYLDICKTHPTQPSHMKAHVFKMTHQSLQVHTDVRKTISDLTSEGRSLVECYSEIVNDLLEREKALLGEGPAGFATREEYAATIHQLGNVSIPERNVIGSMTTAPDAESEYRRKKDEKLEAMLEDVPAPFDLFDEG